VEREQKRGLIQDLVNRFVSRQHEYESSGYLESQLRMDFINDLFSYLGWDINNKANLPTTTREVLVEKGETKGRPDYSFRVNGEDSFFVEAKAVSRGTDKPDDIFQAKLYGWNTRKVNIVILTDFKSFKVFDASLKPTLNQPKVGLLFELRCEDFATTGFNKLWSFSRGEVIRDSLNKLMPKDAVSKRLRIPVDAAFLEQMTIWREMLAKDIYKNNSEITVGMLNDVVQRLLDRLVFIRILEDRKIIESKTLRDIAENWRGAKHRDIQVPLNTLFRKLNDDFNGNIFKSHPCETTAYSSGVVAEIIDDLYYPKSPYDFAVLGVDLLGVIYEKYLGKTIRLTERRVKVEEKPEVRHAGGVYYTPKWVVNYITDSTVGELIKNKKPDEIAKIRILDPACGSGSFLIGALDKLFKYHERYYSERPNEGKVGTLFPFLLIERDEDGNVTSRLSIETKARILRNNIYGVDIDPQAVEITMMSLYIKVLEGEKTLPHNKEILPSLSNNIKCGNSLISFDFLEQQELIDNEARENINPFNWMSKSTGFGDIMESGKFDVVIGNPPYVRSIWLRDNDPLSWKYYQEKYELAFKEFDIYMCFLEKGYHLLKEGGLLGFIMPNKWLHAKMGENARKFFLKNHAIHEIINFNAFQVFDEVTTYTMLIFLRNKDNPAIKVTKYTGPIEKLKIVDFGEKSHWETGDFSYSKLGFEKWDFVVGGKGEFLDRLKENPKFGEYCKLSQGTGTRADDVFYVQKIGEDNKYFKIFSTHTGKNHLIEKEVCKPSLKGKSLAGYQIREKDFLLIFPYRGNEIITKKEIQGKYPKLWAYLEECKNALEERERGRWRDGEWYCFGRPQNHQHLHEKKILIPVIVNKAQAAWDDVGYYIIDSIYFVQKIKETNLDDFYILALLNSKLLTFYLNETSSNLRGGYFSMKSAYVEPFPLKVPNMSDPKEKGYYENIVLKAKRITKVYQQLTDTRVNKDLIDREGRVLQEEIDELIYDLYGMTDSEKKIIKES